MLHKVSQNVEDLWFERNQLGITTQFAPVRVEQEIRKDKPHARPRSRIAAALPRLTSETEKIGI